VFKIWYTGVEGVGEEAPTLVTVDEDFVDNNIRDDDEVPIINNSPNDNDVEDLPDIEEKEEDDKEKDKDDEGAEVIGGGSQGGLDVKDVEVEEKPLVNPWEAQLGGGDEDEKDQIVGKDDLVDEKDEETSSEPEENAVDRQYQSWVIKIGGAGVIG
jgi:hypothetical protein